MTISPSDVAKLSQLAEASYVKFGALKDEYSDSKVRAALRDPQLKGYFSASQADSFIEHWRVVDHQANTTFGYSSTLFASKDKPSEFVFAMRGTEPILLDGMTDIGDIVFDGLAIDQIVDMYNEWQRLNAPSGTPYRAAYLQPLPTETSGYQGARLGQDAFGVEASTYLAYLRGRSDLVIDDPVGLVKKISFAPSDTLFASDPHRRVGSGAIPSNAVVTVTGHSLGGHLAAAFTRLFPEVNASALSINGAGFANGKLPGLGGNALSNISNVFKSLGGSDSFPRDRIVNVYGSVAPELVTMDSPNGLVQQGRHVAMTTEDFSVSNTLGHGADQMTDAAAAQDLFFRLDPALAAKPISEATGVVAPIIAAGSVNPTGRFERAVDSLGELLLPDHPKLNAADAERTDALYKYIAELRDAIKKSPATLVPLVGKSASDARTLARVDDATGLAARYALSRLNPYVADGLDYSRFDGAHELDRYDAQTGSGMLTDNWIDDRATFLKWKSAAAVSRGNPLRSDRFETYVFEDRGAGNNVSLTVEGRQKSTRFNPAKILFGSAQGDSIVGSDLVAGDRLYGMEGDDQIDARGGNDLIEGGRGVDSIHGGYGNDHVFGGNGADQLHGDDDDDIIDGEFDDDVIDGGDGKDTLRGGQGNDELSGGSQDDELDGGADVDVLDGGHGNDFLYGGAGDDQYRLHSGDGSDVIDDADGRGRISIDQGVIGSPDSISTGFWRETVAGIDLRYAFSPDASGRGNLFITSTAGTLTVKNFKSGDLSIVLPGLETQPIDIPAPATSIIGTAGDDNRTTGPKFAIKGANGSERLQGLAGRDEVLGSGGNDAVEGGTGIDVVAGDAGDDAVFADSAIDDVALRNLITTSATAPTAGAMPAKLQVTTSEWMRGGLGADTLVGSTTNDVMFGGGGSDLIVGGTGHDLINGDDDYEPGDITTAYVQPGVGAAAPFNAYYSPVIIHDVSFDVGAADEIHAGSGDDAVYAEFGNDVAWGDDGNDTMSGGEDDDALYGGNGNDRLAGDDYGQLIGATVTTPIGSDFIDGGAGSDQIYGDGGKDVLFGGDGNDTIRGNNDIAQAGVSPTAGDDGDDYLSGGAGNDSLAGDSGSDTLYGDDGDDAMFGDGNSTPDAYQGDDHMEGGAGDDTMRGYGGADTLLGGLGNDYLYGEAGDDYLDVGEDALGTSSINTAYGGDGNDTIVAYLGQQNILVGDDGDDTITGEGQVWGQAGNDTITVRGGYVDVVGRQSLAQGGDGDDVIRLPSGGVSAYGEAGDDLMEGGDGTSYMSAGDGDDIVTGGEGNEYAWGQAGVDMMSGGGGNDQLSAGDGDDELTGDGGNDVLFGDDGNDVLAGGPGRNYLDGGLGDDRYIVDSAGEIDTIVDAGGNNVIEFADGIVADALSYAVGVDALGNDQHLVISDLLSGGSVTVVNAFAGAVSEYRFADGTTLSASDVAARAQAAGARPQTRWQPSAVAVIGSAEGDRLTFTSAAAAIDAGYGNDTLAGGAFNDTLTGSYGDDRLTGGGGRDVLDGGEGRDTYVIGLQDGGTRILDKHVTASPATEVDTIEFSAGVSAAQTRLLRNGSDLVIALNGGPAQVAIDGYFVTSVPVAGGGTNYLDRKIERMQFTDGTTWDAAQIAARIEQGTVNAMTGTAGNDTFVVDNVQDTVVELANGGDDTIRSSVSFGLPLNVERLVLTGSLDANAWGHAGNAVSYLVGNDGNNMFNAGGPPNYLGGGAPGGYSVMSGGKGDDTYYLDYFKGGEVIESPNEGNDTVILTHGAHAYTLPANVENAIDVNGAMDGNADAGFSIMGNERDNWIGYKGSSVGHVPFYLDGGPGADTMQGGFDDDVYIVDNPLDRVVETGLYGGGAQSSFNDEIRSSVSYALPDNVESLTLTGAGAIDGFGNALGNRFDGTVNGASNRLAGGLGDDFYRVQPNDTVVERADEGWDTVQLVGAGTREYTMADAPMNVEALALDESAGASDLTGNADDNGLIGNNAANRIAAGAGNDILTGYGGDDTLTGGSGNDRLTGGDGTDTYRFAAGFGQDILTDPITVTSAAVNALIFDASIARSDVYFDAGKLTVRGTQDSIALAKSTGTYSNRPDGTPVQENFYGSATFADGTSMEAPEVSARLVASFSHVRSAFADGLEGTAGNDTLDGGAGTDVLDGLAGNDTLVGGDHSDWLFGGDGDDRMSGDQGYDQMRGGAGADQLAGGADNDTLHGDEGDDVASGDDGDDNVHGDTGNDRLTGGAGRDTLSGGADNDVVAAGDDADTVHGDDGNDQLDGGAGTDTLYGDAGDDLLDGGADRDTLYGGAGNDTLRAGAADASLMTNTLLGGDGNDVLQGGDGYDQLLGEAGDDVLEGGGGDDTLYDDSGNNVLRGGDGDDRLDTWDGNDVLDGGAGNDILSGYAGVDTYVLSAGTGSDLVGDNWRTGELTIIAVDASLTTADVHITRGRDANSEFLSVNANGGADELKMRYPVVDMPLEVHFADGTVWTPADVANQLYLREGTPGPDTLVGSVGDDKLYGYAGADTLSGLDGNDLLDGGTEADTMDGGNGNDTFVVDDAGDLVIEAALAGLDGVQASISYVLPANVDQLTLTGSAQSATGNTLDNRLTGNAGNNVLDGKAGRDAMAGGAGNDTYVVDNAGDTVTESINEGVDTVQSSVTFTLAADFENLTLVGSAAINGTGNAAANQLTGNAAANTLTGGAGDDRLDGGAGADALKGGTGNDVYVVDNASDAVTELAAEGTDSVLSSVTHTLAANVEHLTLTGSAAVNGTGNTLANTIVGNAAANVLNGGTGADTLSGGAGNDTYVIDNAGDIVTELANEGSDIVQSSITHTLATNVETLTLTGTAAVNGTGNALANVLNGNTGNNALDGGAGADAMKGGAGNDTYVVDNAGDAVTELASEGTDTIQTTLSLTLAANVENLTLTGTTAINGTGNALANVLVGNAADNVLSGGAGSDTMKGGAGNDTYVVDVSTDVVTELAAEGTDTVQSSVTLALGANVENLTLTGTAAINGTGNALANVITGNAADNLLDGGTGADTLSGGAGNDSYVVDNAADVVTESAGAGFDAVSAAITYVLPANVEQLTLTGAAAVNGTGNAIDDWLRGNAAANTLAGMDGKDALWGDLGNDALDGSNGNDLLQGGGGNDAVSDIAGNNLLDGGAGTDALTGGAGREMLIGGAGADTLVTGGGADVIAFNKGDGADVVQASVGTDDTLTLGGGVAYGDLTLRKSGLDLILGATGGDQITFRNWYQAGVNNKSVLNLQIVVDAMAAFSPTGTDPLLKRKVADFNFTNIVGQFDAALAATPTLTSWNVSNALASSLVSGSDTAAIGGDLAYDFGHRNALTGIGAGAAGTVLASASFGTSAQTLQAASTLYAGTVRLN